MDHLEHLNGFPIADMANAKAGILIGRDNVVLSKFIKKYKQSVKFPNSDVHCSIQGRMII